MLQKGNVKGPEPTGSRGDKIFYTFHIHHGGTVVKGVDKEVSDVDKGQDFKLGGDSAANSGERENFAGSGHRNEEARSFKRGNMSYVGRALGRRGKKSDLGRTLDKGKRKLINEQKIDNFGEDFSERRRI